jgi:hypothetical protein
MSIMSFIRMKKGHLEKNGNNLNRFFNFKFRYIRYQQISVMIVSLYLFHWTWDKGWQRYREFCFISSPTPWHGQWRPAKSEPFWHLKWFQFFHCNLSIYIFVYLTTFKQHLHMTYISRSWLHILELVVPIMVYLIGGTAGNDAAT